MRKAVKIVLVLLVVYVIACLGLLVAMHQPPARFGKIMARIENPVVFILLPFKQLWFVARDGQLEAGDAAPDFSLKTQDQQHLVSLSSSRGKRPVVLVFGSYT